MNGLTSILMNGAAADGWQLWMQRIGWAVVHSAWQLTLLAVMAVLVTRWFGRDSAQRRYRIQCVLLLLMLTVPVVSVFLIDPETERVEPAAGSFVGSESTDFLIADDITGELPPDQMAQIQSSEPSSTDARTPRKPGFAVAMRHEPGQQAGVSSFGMTFSSLVPWLSVLWLGGFGVLSLWQLAGWCWLTRTVRRLDTHRIERLERLAADYAGQLGLKRVVRVIESSLVRAPAVAGFWRPVILMPIEVVTGLPVEQMSSVIAHELAHIHRRDSFVNALQTVAETVLFYHPAVWWLSRRIRIDREHCADDVAIELTGDRLQYARALTSVAEISQRVPGALVAANGGDLKARIARILHGSATPRASISWGWLPLVAVLLVGTLVQTVSYSSRAGDLIAALQDGSPAADRETSEEPGPSDTPAAGGPVARAEAKTGQGIMRLGTSNWRHALPLELAAWSSNDKYIATAEQDGDIRVWDRKNGRDLFLAETGRRQSAYGMTFSPDGTRLAFVDNYGIAWGFSVPDGKQLFRTMIPKVVLGKPVEPINSGGLDWSPDGSTIAAKAGGSLALLNADDGSIRLRRISRAGIRHAPVAYSLDGKRLAVAEQRIVQVYTADKLETITRCVDEEIMEAHADSVVSIVWAKNRGHDVVVSGGRGAVRTVRIGNTVGSAVDEVRAWDPATGNLITGFESQGFSNGVFGIRAIGPDFETVAVMTNVAIQIHKVAGGGIVRTINNGFNSKGDMFQNCLAVSPDGEQVVAPAQGNQLGFWKIETGNPIAPVHTLDIRSKPKLNPDAKLVLGAHAGPVRFLCASRDGKVAVSGSQDGMITVWDSEHGFVMHQTVMRDRSQQSGLSSLALSPDGSLLAGGVGHRIGKGRDNIIGEGTIQVWHLVKGEGGIPMKRQEVDFVPGKMAFSPSQKVLAVGSDNRFGLFYSFRKELKPEPEKLREKIYLLRTSNNERDIVTLPGHAGQFALLTFKGPDRLISAATDGWLRTWDLAARLSDGNSDPDEQELKIADHTTRASINRLGSWLATNTIFGEHVELQSIDGKSQRQIPVGNAKGAELALSPDGRLLATAGQMLTRTTGRFDESVYVWQTGNGKQVLKQKAIDGAATSLMFTADDSKLLIGTARGTVLIVPTAAHTIKAPEPSGSTARDRASARPATQAASTPPPPTPEPVKSDPPSRKEASKNEKPAKKARAKAEPVTRKQAVERAIEFLRKKQKETGSWSDQGDREDGQTPLVGYAMLKAGVPGDDPAIRKCADYLAQRTSSMTYHVGFEMLFWLELDDDRSKAILRKYIDMLEEGQTRKGPAAGQWRYRAGVRGMDGDSSNTGIALWALIEAARAGHGVDQEVFQRSMKHLLENQSEDGGWGYVTNSRATGGMTCSSFDSLLGCADVLARKEDEEVRAAREQAIKWIDRNLEKQIIQSRAWRYYGFMHLGRIGREEKMKTLGGVNWFLKAWDHLASVQRADGSWLSPAGPPLSGATTAFPLIFLGMLEGQNEPASATRFSRPSPSGERSAAPRPSMW